MKKKIIVTLDTDTMYVEGKSGVLIGIAINGDYEEFEANLTTISHRKILELIDKGLNSEDIIELRKQGIL